MNLPYERVSNIGMLIPILYEESRKGFLAGKNPVDIVEAFFERHAPEMSESEQIDFLFRVIQYVERQVVLFDAVEDAAFGEITQLTQTHTFDEVYQIAKAQNKLPQLRDKLADFGVRIVFTAHPTQFYPPAIQVIIHDLREAILHNDIGEIDRLLQQLGITSFLNQKKPTPLDEARSILYYLRYVYYDAIGELYQAIRDKMPDDDFENDHLLQLGFWPGGDRDGNPFVTADITRQVSAELRMTLMKCYYNDLKKLRRRLTFRKVTPILEALSGRLYKNMFAVEADLSYEHMLSALLTVRELLRREYNGLFADQLEAFITKVRIFKTHFATLDIRQDSRKHAEAVRAIAEKYHLADRPVDELSEEARIELFTKTAFIADENHFEDPLIADTIQNIKQLRDIQKMNGEAGANRYIISNSEDIFAVLHVYALFKWCGWKDDEITVDIIPLFETIEGLTQAEKVMKTLYEQPVYAQHLRRRGNRQTIMLGFSDGTKDGGYLKANWEIFNAKERLSRISDQYDIRAIFFDGRGGPPARGGGKTHRFYAAQGEAIANHEIQLTIQGQTITSMYGTIEQFKHNSEQLITAGLANDIFGAEKNKFSDDQRALMDELANISFHKYEALKKHPAFIPYLEKMSTLKYYGKANIGSRPAKRGKKKQLTLADLRAISFVGSWSQLKQNVPGYFGIGTALNELKKQGRLDEVRHLFHHQAFFKTLILNSMMSMTKTFFPLTAYMKSHPEFGEFWQILYDEYELSRQMMLEISGYKTLMEEEVISRTSVEIREKMVLPLLTIQQYALQKTAAGGPHTEIFEKIVMRSLFGNINASRNSA
ncbi:MAG: phosphoenolpyruvate carboxylase [Bacteroidetes bacterium]|nr:MAG: phosphoenolpyruvate carboxylase [Bacteroidota bacterium]